MNEDKILDLLKDLVGGDMAFEWVGAQMGKGIHKGYESTHKAAHSVVGGVAVVSRGAHHAMDTAKDEFAKGWYGYDGKQTPSMDPENELDRKVEAVLDGYGLNKGEKKFCKARIGIMSEKAKEAMELEPDPKKKAAAGVAAMDKAIKENVQFYGGLRALYTKGDKGLDEYFKDDVAKKEAFIQEAELTSEFEKLKEAKLNANPSYIQKAESALKYKANILQRGWERTESEQQKMDAHMKLKM